MENNKNIGTIDTLMIARSLLQQGYTAIKNNINNHQFKIGKLSESTPSEYVFLDNPYCITHHCQRYENSALSDQVFEKIKNPLNSHSNAIDKCTQYTMQSSNEAIVTATFYDKKSLKETLKRIHHYTQQIT
jgi:hypothetical protein